MNARLLYAVILLCSLFYFGCNRDTAVNPTTALSENSEDVRLPDNFMEMEPPTNVEKKRIDLPSGSMPAVHRTNRLISGIERFDWTTLNFYRVHGNEAINIAHGCWKWRSTSSGEIYVLQANGWNKRNAYPGGARDIDAVVANDYYTLDYCYIVSNFDNRIYFSNGYNNFQTVAGNGIDNRRFRAVDMIKTYNHICLALIGTNGSLYYAEFLRSSPTHCTKFIQVKNSSVNLFEACFSMNENRIYVCGLGNVYYFNLNTIEEDIPIKQDTPKIQGLINNNIHVGKLDEDVDGRLWVLETNTQRFFVWNGSSYVFLDSQETLDFTVRAY